MEIVGKIILNDDTESEFSILSDGGWQQWGADTGRLGRTVDILDAMAAAAFEAGE